MTARVKPRILFIVPSAYEALQRKGVLHTIRERDLDGFFGRIVTVHPRTRRTRWIPVDAHHTIREFGPDAFPGSRYSRLIRIIQAPHYAWRTLRETVRLVRNHRIDLIQATDPYWMGLLGWMVARLTGRPLCVSIHADYDKRYLLDGPRGAPVLLGSRGLAKRLERFVLCRANTVLPIRESLSEKALDAGVDLKCIRVYPHGVDFGPFMSPARDNVREHFALPRDKHILSFVGRLSNENYVDDLIDIASRLRRTRDDFVLVIVGGGKEEARLKARLADAGLHDCVRMVGFQSREIVAEVRKASTISLCPMGGFSLIEACAAGSPPIAYDIEWHRELVRHGKTGYLLRERDTDGATEAVNYLLDNPKSARSLGRAARKLAVDRHGWENVRDAKRKTYAAIISAHRKRRSRVRF